MFLDLNTTLLKIMKQLIATLEGPFNRGWETGRKPFRPDPILFAPVEFYGGTIRQGCFGRGRCKEVRVP
jgi:hypothetical protein